MNAQEMDDLGKSCQGCGCSIMLAVMVIVFLLAVFFIGC